MLKYQKNIYKAIHHYQEVVIQDNGNSDIYARKSSFSKRKIKLCHPERKRRIFVTKVSRRQRFFVASLLRMTNRDAYILKIDFRAMNVERNFNWLYTLTKNHSTLIKNSGLRNSRKPLVYCIFLELIIRLELTTSSLPRTRSADWAISAKIWTLPQERVQYGDPERDRTVDL